MMSLAFLHALARGVDIEGQFPTGGGALIVFNHESIWDGLTAFEAAWRQVGRMIRPVVRDDLIDWRVPESQEVLGRTGKGRDFLHSGSTLYRRLNAYILNGVDPIPINRVRSKRQTFKTINQALGHGELVGISFTDTRHPFGDLRAGKDAAAGVAYFNPNIPVIPCGLIGTRFSMSRIILRLGDSFTYQERVNQSGKKKLEFEDISLYLAQQLSALLPDELQREWRKNPTLLPKS